MEREKISLSGNPVMLRCVPGKVKAMGTHPGQPFRSLFGLPRQGHILLGTLRP